MHLHNPQRTRSFQARPGRGWQPLGYGELLPESRDYPHKKIYSGDDTVAALTTSFQTNAEVQHALAACKAAQRRAANALTKWLLHEGQDKLPVINAELEVRSKLVQLTNVCMQHASQKDQPWVPELTHNQEHCSVKYTRYSTNNGKLMTPTQAVEAWTCPMNWDTAQLFEALDAETEGFNEHCIAVYKKLADHCPNVLSTGRLKLLMSHAAQSGALQELAKKDTFASRCELPVDGYKPLTVASATITDDQNGTMVHTIGTVRRQLRASNLWDNPRLVYALQRKLDWFLQNEAARHECNLVNIVVKITAPHPADPDKFETHVLEIMPFAGPNSCTVTAIWINNEHGKEVERGSAKGFLNLPPTYTDDDTEPPGEVLGDSLTAYLCPASHRNCRLGLHDMIKIFCQKSLAGDGWLVPHEADLLPSDPDSSLVWYTRHQEHDILLATYKITEDVENSPYANHSDTHSVIVSVHYPPYITHWPSSRTFRPVSNVRPRPPPFNHDHYPSLPPGHGPARASEGNVRPPRERVKLVKPDAPLHVPFFAQLIAGHLNANDLLEERYYMDYRALSGADLHSFQIARGLVEEFAADTARTISVTFGGEGWNHGETIYQNILHQGWNSETRQRLDPQIQSAREMWFTAWDDLICTCIGRKLNHADSNRFDVSLHTLLDFGVFKPRGHFS